MGIFDKENYKILPLDNINEKSILIELSEYKELLIIKGKYEEIQKRNCLLIEELVDELRKKKITPNQIRKILGLQDK